MDKNFIMDELTTIAPALSTGSNKTMPYRLPNGYFDNLAENLLAQIKNETFIQKTATPFSLPNNYFDSLSNNILEKIKSENGLQISVFEELDEIAPFLNTIPKGNIYHQPLGYFEQINPLKALLDKPTAKVIVFKPTKKWINYAVAASLSGILVVTAFLFSDKNNKFDYSAYYKLDVKTNINKVPDAELEKYLKSYHQINTDVVNTMEILLPDVKEHLKTVSDEELQQYLKQIDAPVNPKTGG